LISQILAKQNRPPCFYFCGMKRILQPSNPKRGIFILILPLILSGCGLFKNR